MANKIDIQPDHLNQIHIVPSNDLKPHIQGSWCWCAPMIEYINYGTTKIFTHNSLDGREFFENDNWETTKYENI